MSRRTKAAFGLGALLALASPSARAANVVLVPPSIGASTEVHQRAAVAVTPYGNVRWSEFAVRGSSRALVLVPVREGARLDWAAPAWLDALDAATEPVVFPPAAAAACPTRTRPEVVPFGFGDVPRANAAVRLLGSADLAAHVAAGGYFMPVNVSEWAEALLAEGWLLAAMDVSSPSTSFTSPSLRVLDDAAPVVPTVLASAETRVTATAFTVGRELGLEGASTVTARPPAQWAAAGSSYARERGALVERGHAVRETSVALFGAAEMAPANDVAGPLFLTLIAPPGGGLDCVAEGVTAATLGTPVAPTCAPGMLVGSGPCTAAGGGAPATPYTCGARAADLALAVAGAAASEAMATRFVYAVQPNDADRPLVAQMSGPLRRGRFAKIHAPCGEQAAHETGASGASSGSRAPGAEPTAYPVTTEGCSGGTSSTIVVDTIEAEADDDSGLDSWWEDDSGGWDADESETCSGDTTSSSDGWDDGESCSGDSSDSESCDGGSTGDDGWDTAMKSHRRGPSPLSRLTMVAAALVLPLRRRWRAR